jgi:TRAP-type C4-dicarboxylate transport system permease small subunit
LNHNASKSSRWQAGSTRLLEWLCIVMMGLMVLDVIWGVFSRFILKFPSRWTDELATFLLIWVAMLGGALAHRQGMHLGVVWLAERLDAPIAQWVARFVHVLIVLFAAIVMVYGGIFLVQDRFRFAQVLPALGWSKAWMYLAVPVAGVFIIAYSIRELLWPTPRVPSETQEPTPTPPRGGVE